MKKSAAAIMLIISISIFSQNINGKLGLNGQFILRDTTNTFLTLLQNTGYLNLNRSLVLPNTAGSTTGVIYKGTDRFIHNYQGSGTQGQNTFTGINSGNFTMTGLGNTAYGTRTLFANTTGNLNTAFGYYSLPVNTTGSSNSAFGNYSLNSNQTGNHNSAFGIESLTSNSAGYENSAFGNNTLYSNTTGWHNTAVGFDALRNNIGGFQNTAVGHHSLQNNTGNFNTAIGYNSGSAVTSGSNLTLVGIDANPTSPTATNQITLGNQFVTSLRCNVTTITSLSDRRDKTNIEELSLGLDFITKLKPRQFNWDRREWYESGVSDGNKKSEAPTAGFIAQELDSAQINANAEWLNLVLKDNSEKWEATPGNLLPVMVKAIQELNDENHYLKIKNTELEERLAKYEMMQKVILNEIEEMKNGNSDNKIVSTGN